MIHNFLTFTEKFSELRIFVGRIEPRTDHGLNEPTNNIMRNFQKMLNPLVQKILGLDNP